MCMSVKKIYVIERIILYNCCHIESWILNIKSTINMYVAFVTKGTIPSCVDFACSSCALNYLNEHNQIFASIISCVTTEKLTTRKSFSMCVGLAECISFELWTFNNYGQLLNNIVMRVYVRVNLNFLWFHCNSYT